VLTTCLLPHVHATLSLIATASSKNDLQSPTCPALCAHTCNLYKAQDLSYTCMRVCLECSRTQSSCLPIFERAQGLPDRRADMEQPTRPHARHHLQPPFCLRQQSSTAQFSSRSTEADDERSYASSTTSSMSLASIPDEDDTPSPSYHGEDTRPTSRKELAGFYAYSFAAEVFVICGLGAFIPITLEDLARGSASAVLASDPTRSCKTKIDIPEIAATFSTYSNGGRKHTNGQCVFRLLGMEINTASFAMYTFSISVLLQALVVVTMSGAADHGQFRKTMLLTFAAVGAVATMLFLPITPNAYLLGSLWAIIGNVCFGASFVLLNSFLPLLVRHHPQVLGRHRSRDPRSEDSDEVSLYSVRPSLCPGASFSLSVGLTYSICLSGYWGRYSLPPPDCVKVPSEITWSLLIAI
jgi:hypothetical protein